ERDMLLRKQTEKGNADAQARAAEGRPRCGRRAGGAAHRRISAQGALSRGEIDWWESPSRDLADTVARDRHDRAVLRSHEGACASGQGGVDRGQLLPTNGPLTRCRRLGSRVENG